MLETVLNSNFIAKITYFNKFYLIQWIVHFNWLFGTNWFQFDNNFFFLHLKINILDEKTLWSSVYCILIQVLKRHFLCIIFYVYKAHLHKVAFLSTVTSLDMPIKQKTIIVLLEMNYLLLCLLKSVYM